MANAIHFLLRWRAVRVTADVYMDHFLPLVRYTVRPTWSAMVIFVTLLVMRASLRKNTRKVLGIDEAFEQTPGRSVERAVGCMPL